ncbi:MAG: hypothetical protein AB8G99_10250 [Planctomycetaceae bacterium]
MARLKLGDLAITVSPPSEPHYDRDEFWFDLSTHLASVCFQHSVRVSESALTGLCQWLEQSLSNPVEPMRLECGDPTLQMFSHRTQSIEGGMLLSVTIYFGELMREQTRREGQLKRGELNYSPDEATHPDEIQRFIRDLRDVLRNPIPTATG